ncbi:hypothetical protein RA210_U80086 [Rubrivivax sp. A210]|uniref:tetratricopeptide repeat protein n=1 Tax=Rubrivivax sp. A210 TaxID=2772301 RepID=UPI00191A46BB|nr:hypothetical protein [Rubrivivax sp. A210]CAD5375004.1 hypothetical protein RA210_U80086 [Rubrivivax sp. A210]
MAAARMAMQAEGRRWRLPRRWGLPALAGALALAAWLGWRALAPAAEAELPPLAADSAADTRYEALAQQIARYPRDARARVLKARMDLRAERFDLAVAGYRQALEMAPKVARDAGVWVELAEALGLAQGGRLAGEPTALIARALGLDADHPQALDLAGSAAWEAGDFAGAATHWRRLRARLAPGDTRHTELSAAIVRAEQRARLALPPPR